MSSPRHICYRIITIVTFTFIMQPCFSGDELQGTRKKTHMKKITIDWSNGVNEAVQVFCSRPGNPGRYSAMLGVAVAGLLAAAQPAQAGSIFVIAMENHNLTQPNPTNSPQQILNNPAAPYINSLMTPGNPNAIHTSYAVRYFNAGIGVHPSEPNYVWAAVQCRGHFLEELPGRCAIEHQRHE
jgi:hypothetical protein